MVVSISWIEDKIALAWEDLEYCLESFGLDLDLDVDKDLLTSPFWVSYYSDLPEKSPDRDETGLHNAQSQAAKLFSMLPPAVASIVHMPLGAAANAIHQARIFLRNGQQEVALEWTISATNTIGRVLGAVSAASSDDMSAETQRLIRRDAAILGHAKNHESKAQAIELYLKGTWSSKDRAAEEIAKTVNRATRTVRGWLLGV